MDAIKQGGAALNPVEPQPQRRASAIVQGGGLMSQIREGGASLKKVVQEKVVQKPSGGGGMFGELMAAMEKNRSAIQAEDHSDGSDSDSDNDFN